MRALLHVVRRAPRAKVDAAALPVLLQSEHGKVVHAMLTSLVAFDVTCRSYGRFLPDAAKEQVKKLVMEDGVVSKGLMAREQHAAHSLAWIATYKATLTELLNWAERLESENKFWSFFYWFFS